MNIVKGFIRSMSRLCQDHAFEDFKVIVDGDIYTCHSVILAGCSDFFAGLLRSNMKEKQNMEVHLMNISSATFKLIINSIYNGCEMLTKENVCDVWSAVHQLQIQFLIDHCEQFVLANLTPETIWMYKDQAEYLQSEKVSDIIFKFIVKNFIALREKEIFLRSDFQYLTKLFKIDKLEVSSEDLVLDLIFDWVNYGAILAKDIEAIKNVTTNKSKDVILDSVDDIVSHPNMTEPNKENSSLKLNSNLITEEDSMDASLNQEEHNERQQFLISLIKSTRYCLQDDAFILSLSKNKRIESDILLKEIWFEILTFKFYDYCHGHWPTSAIHRDCVDVEHVGVYSNCGYFYALSFKKHTWFSFQKLPQQLGTKLIVLKGNLYACQERTAPNEIHVLRGNMWVRVTGVTHSIMLSLTHEKYIYLFGVDDKQITRFNPEACHINLELFKHNIENVQYALSFHNNIVVFSSVDNNGVEETAVHCWNTKKTIWTKLDNLEFSCESMTSFRGDRDTYILNSNGNLWKLTGPEIVGFTFVAKLWIEKHQISGALLFRDTLVILFNDTIYYTDVVNAVAGVFSSIQIWKTDVRTSNFVHYVIPAKELIPF